MTSNTNGSKKKSRVSSKDIAYMKSLNAAVLQKSPVKMSLVLYIIAFLTCASIIWANIAEVDEMTRGMGRVIPSRQIQIIQNLEGGIIEKINVQEGEHVKKGQVLVTIDDTGFGSSYNESRSKEDELRAKLSRLRAESEGSKFNPDPDVHKNFPELIDEERKLYKTNLERRDSEIATLKERTRQREIELQDARAKLKNLKASRELILREMRLTKPMFDRGLVSEVEYLQLQQKELENKTDIESLEKSLGSIQSQIIEAKSMIDETYAKYKSVAQEELNETLAELKRVSTTQVAMKDRVNRAQVRSPVDGTVNQLLVNTVGGVVKPGMDILEIVPDDDALLVEAKIKPSDIAFIYPGLRAVVKLTAYDFAIYGGLDGEVVHISADTIIDEKQEHYYLVRIKTDKSYLGDDEDKKDIMVGMTVMADIVTGKKTVMQYLMKPILRAKYNALRER
ncbi:type I secretion membrane fusion protein, HlyD family [Denitrovibrio acetiphilus DSM 12809]|uniref:Type I secretion membrane fusion protein, HlyD family n=1 Tax=Denitrovibrio acetiphilus (strain DSM 12809 / NBRC 114555 / N2460) TaxID=522772 RepID=D4H1V2_DENA2|nr:HlyD family type I secretion periplasmic adaptor subunit [Denitrovibrio acetiphilus]ADD66929.1 type I secretion membrane fusion protein, HlyD family [Denitrovibrio acetiphilus DSM 12809]